MSGRLRAARYGAFVGSSVAKAVERQMAIVLIEEREEPFVVAWRHPEQFDELAIAALRLLQSRLNQLAEIGLGELAIDERRIDDRPEALAADDHEIPEHFG